MTNERDEKYTGLFPEYRNLKQRDKRNKISNRMRKQRHTVEETAQLEANEKHIKTLSNKQVTESQIDLLAKGLKFIPTAVTKDNHIKQQLLRDFEQFARRNTCTTVQKRNNILSTSNQTGIHQCNNL